MRAAAAVAALVLAAAASGCGDAMTPRGYAGTWEDLGTLPPVERAWTVAVLGDRVFVGTSAGVYARPLEGSGGWQPAGLPGLDVHVLRGWPATGTLYAAGYPTAAGVQPVYRSSDGGTSWVAAGTGLVSDFTGDPLGVHDLALQVGAAPSATPVLYAVASGTNIARSRDDGASWTIVHGVREEMATYDCQLHVLGDRLYQGCEAPLDDAWVRRYDVSQRDQPALGDGSLVIHEIENRRINGFASFPAHPTAASRLFVGVEGGLLALEPTGSWRFLHEFTQASPRYTYVRSIWVDPADERHIVFGGGEEHDISDRSGLWETTDGGATVRTVQSPLGIDFLRAGVPAAVTTGSDGRQFIMLVDEGGRHRRVVRWAIPAR
jgi:hypothetical protein